MTCAAPLVVYPLLATAALAPRQERHSGAEGSPLTWSSPSDGDIAVFSQALIDEVFIQWARLARPGEIPDESPCQACRRTPRRSGRCAAPAPAAPNGASRTPPCTAHRRAGCSRGHCCAVLTRRHVLTRHRHAILNSPLRRLLTHHLQLLVRIQHRLLRPAASAQPSAQPEGNDHHDTRTHG